MIEESNLFDRDIDGGSLDCEDCPGESAEDWNGLEAIPAQEGRGEGREYAGGRATRAYPFGV